MSRLRRVLVMAILGVVMMGFGFISAADADKAPFMPPDYYFVPDHPEANNVNGRIFPGYVYDETAGPWNIFEQSDVSFIFQTWVYWIVELDIFPQPIQVHVWVREAGAGDDAWSEVKLSRHSAGCGNWEDWLDPSWLDPVIVSGPLYMWYAYFEPGYWNVGAYETHLQYTCKNPDNPRERMIVWDTVTGELLDYYGMFLVTDGGISP
ncbi:MAG: hypothetical protein ACFFFK_01675 [Candidatus Thorarchaeota archaeon]